MKNEESNYILHDVIKNGLMDTAKLLLAKGEDVNLKDSSGDTPLFMALGNRTLAEFFEQPHVDFINLLIAKGADVNSKNSHNNTPLHNAAYKGNQDVIELLISKGADVNLQNDTGQTPLYGALKYQNSEIVELLINKSADVKIKDNDANTPLHIAAETGSRPIVQLLIDKGAVINSENNSGETPVMCAFKNNKKSIVELLVSSGADTSLNFAAYIGDLEKMKSFIESGADINLPDTDGYTPLQRAAQNGYINIAQLLIENGAMIDSKGAIGRTALHEACKNGQKEIVELLLSRKANVNEKTIKMFMGRGAFREYWPGDITPLFLATRYPDIVELLISHGAEVNGEKNTGERLVREALIHGARRSADLLINNGAEIDMHLAAYAGALEKVKSLIENGADINAIEDRQKDTPLHKAVKGGHKEVVELLLANKAEIDIKNEEDYTPLQNAVMLGYREIAEVLINSGANIEVVSEGKMTLLHWAAGLGHKDMVEMLLAHNMDVKAKDQKGKIPSDYVVGTNFTDVYSLLNNGVVSNKQNSDWPYRMIVREKLAVRRFLMFEGYSFDDIWIPEEKDLEGLESNLKTSLERNTINKKISSIDREFVLKNLRRYNREYSGFTQNGVKYIICQMHCLGGTMYVASTPSAEYPNQFSIIFDGGSAIVRVLFEADSKKIVWIECNGVA
jgi:ankyrin repeat protein